MDSICSAKYASPLYVASNISTRDSSIIHSHSLFITTYLSTCCLHPSIIPLMKLLNFSFLFFSKSKVRII